MPASKKLQNYPHIFWAVAIRTHTHARATLPFSDRGKAIAFRQRFYAWRDLLDEPEIARKARDMLVRSPIQQANGTWLLPFETNDAAFEELSKYLDEHFPAHSTQQTAAPTAQAQPAQPTFAQDTAIDRFMKGYK